MRKIWETPGGIHPAENKAQSVTRPIGYLPLPERLWIALNQHAGPVAKPLVAVGDQVLKGQMIARPESDRGTALHAPSSGRVVAIAPRAIAHPSGLPAECIEILCDGRDQWIDRHPIENYRNTEPSALLDLLAERGVAGLGGAGFPTAIKLATDRPIELLLVNATECEPYITADDSLLRERADQLLQGIDIASYLLGDPTERIIGIEDNKPEAIAALRAALAARSDQLPAVELAIFPTKYPSGGEKQLIQIVIGQELPSGALPAQLGIVCQNVGTLYALKRAVVNGEPLISRITTVTGKACAINGNYETLIGTPVTDLLAHNQLDSTRLQRLIMGGPMMGIALPDSDLPIIKTSNCFIAADNTEVAPEQPAQPCIRCGLCAEACPATLLPQQLFWHAQSQQHDKLEAHNLFDCIECGACSYVCPSNIPLVQYFRAGKGEIRQQRAEKAKSDFARERFEFRQQRLEQQERDKQAKREARKLAAQQAKEAQSEASAPADSAAALIAAAQARAAARTASPEQQRNKLKRAITSSEARLQRATEKVTEAQQSGCDDATLQPLLAAQAAAQQKLTQAEAKLAELSAAPEREPSPAPTQADSKSPELDAASRAIAKARATAAAREALSPAEKIAGDIAALDKRVEKLRDKLAACEEDEQRELLATSLAKLEAKQASLQEQQRALNNGI